MMTIPYKSHGRDERGVDCYGLVKLLYKQEQGIDIVDFDYKDPNDPQNEHFYFDNLENPRWRKVEPQKGCVVALRAMGYISHCGYMVSDTEFLHITEKTGVARVSIFSPKWEKRIVGFYKHD